MTKKVYQEELSKLIDLGDKAQLDGFEKNELVQEFAKRLEELEEKYNKEFTTPEGFRSIGYNGNYYSEEEDKWEVFPTEVDVEISCEYGDKEVNDGNKDKAYSAALSQFWDGMRQILQQLKEELDD